MASTPRRLSAGVLVLVMIGTMLSAFALSIAPGAAVAAPGTPGVPGAPIVLFTEDFENAGNHTNVRLTDYVADGGGGYTADPAWSNRKLCNGFIIDRESPATPNDCAMVEFGPGTYDALTALPYGLAALSGAAPFTENAAVASYTAGTGNPTYDSLYAPNLVQFRTATPLTLPTANRFVTFSVDAIAASCFSTHPKLRFYLTDDNGVEHPVSASAIDPCTDSRARSTVVDSRNGTLFNVSGGTFAADSSMLLAGNTFGIVMRNENGGAGGNDGAFDNIRVLDVTPQLDKSFSPASVPVGGTSRLTFTVTNTSELAAKPGWSGTDVLEEGLVVANPTNASSTCTNGSVTATAGGDTIGLAGDLNAGQRSCTFSIDVTSTVPTTGGIPNRFENCASNFPNLVGLNPPACADVEFFGTPELSIDKTSDATTDAAPGDVITYSVTATNVGDDDYTAADPATVTDDLSAVLDDAAFGSATASVGNQPTLDGSLLTWSGPLAIGDSVTLTYSVTLGENGDRRLRNVAWEPVDPSDPETPACDPPIDGADPDTGEPCAEVETLLPTLSIDKSADRTELPAVGEPVEYTVTVTNPGPGDYTAATPATFEDDLSDVIDDATIDTASVSASSGTATFTSPTLSWSGALAAGDSATITYSAVYTGEGDNRLVNLACVPADDVLYPDLPCDSVTIPGAALSEWKQAISSADPLVAGSTITYTLFFDNDGTAPATVDAVDDLTHVTDDTDVTTAPTATGGLTAVRTGDQIAITGSVPVGVTATVTYTVTVRPDGERGDDIASNFLLAPGDTPPTDPECQPTDDQQPDCTTNLISAVTYEKTVVASTDPIESGTELEYTITVTNTGAATANVARTDNLTGVLDDATLTTPPAVSGAGTVTATPVVNGILTIGGTLAAGEIAIVTYTVTVNEEDDRGDNRADNFLVEDPTDVPPTECVEGSVDCTSTPLPNVTTSKSVNPVSGTSVTAGQVLDYTLSFTNDGTTAGAVDYTDYLTDVLDDASVTSQPVSSDPALTASAIAGDEFTVTGSLAAGQTVTVTYSVTVLPDGARGDDRLANFLVDSDGTPPGVDEECETGDPNCTTNPISAIEAWKSVAASETPVAAGTELTYTLTFENTGQGTGDVDYVDDLTHVLDDADVTVEPSSGDLTVSRSGSVISITGPLAAGETATVVYTVTVRADADRGDDLAANFLLPVVPGVPPEVPTDPACQPTDIDRPDCTLTPIGRIVTSKAVEASSDPIEAGSTLTYTITFDNQGQAAAAIDQSDNLTQVLDDATLTSAPVSSDPALEVSPVTNGVFTVTGTLGSGRTATVTYTVTVNEEDDRGDDRADNFLVDDATDVPPTDCLPGSLDCTSTPLPNVTSSKSVDPVSGTTVLAGDVLTYTLTFTNGGNAVGAVDYTDYLSRVLDDATVTSQPVASDSTLVASAIAGDSFTVTGSLAAGQTVTVTYAVTVLPDEERGDHRLTNVLVGSDGTPPGEDEECVTDDPNCTTNPAPNLRDWKSSDPVSGTAVAAGQTVTYTLHFENSGAAAASVSKEDVLTGVLDDADVTSAPRSSDAGLTVSAIVDGRFRVSGALAPGQLATISYEVTVKPYDDQGDHSLGNALVLPGDPPPTACEPATGEDVDCTVHPVGNIIASKSVDPASTTTVAPGDVLAYTLRFENTGSGPSVVDYLDRLDDVLDDATLTAGPTATSGLDVELNGDVLTIGGRLAPGAVGTVTYRVTVDSYDRQENHVLDNYLGTSEETPPSECLEDDPLCTTNPVAVPPPLAVTGGTIGFAALSAGMLLILGALFAVEAVRRRRLEVRDSITG